MCHRNRHRRVTPFACTLVQSYPIVVMNTTQTTPVASQVDVLSLMSLLGTSASADSRYASNVDKDAMLTRTYCCIRHIISIPVMSVLMMVSVLAGSGPLCDLLPPKLWC